MTRFSINRCPEIVDAHELFLAAYVCSVFGPSLDRYWLSFRLFFFCFGDGDLEDAVLVVGLCFFRIYLGWHLHVFVVFALDVSTEIVRVFSVP